MKSPQRRITRRNTNYPRATPATPASELSSSDVLLTEDVSEFDSPSEGFPFSSPIELVSSSVNSSGRKDGGALAAAVFL